MKKSTNREKTVSQKNLNHSLRRESCAVSTKAGQLQGDFTGIISIISTSPEILEETTGSSI
jgi:hypothetical protein